MPDVMDQARVALTARLKRIEAEVTANRARLEDLESERTEIQNVLGAMSQPKRAGTRRSPARRAAAKTAVKQSPRTTKRSRPGPRTKEARIVEFLRATPGATPAQVERGTKLARSTVKKVLEELYATGEIRKVIGPGRRTAGYEAG